MKKDIYRALAHGPSRPRKLIAAQRSKTRLGQAADLARRLPRRAVANTAVIAEELQPIAGHTLAKKGIRVGLARGASTRPFSERAMGDAGGDLIYVMAGAEKAHRTRDFLVRVADQGFEAQGDHAIRPSAVEITRQLRHLKPFAHKTLKVRATGACVARGDGSRPAAAAFPGR